MTFDISIFVSLAFLFGIAAQFRAADGHSFLQGVIATLEGRLGVMYAVAVVTAIFSPFVLNDVLVLILTPVLVAYCKESGADIAPLLVAEVTFTNIAGSLTPQGNPQNILLWQASGISAAAFVGGTWLPLAASGAIAVLALSAFRGRPRKGQPPELRALDWRPAAYLGASTLLVFSSNVAGLSSVLSLGLAFALGFAFNRKSLARLAVEFDVRSLLTLYALVGAVAVVAALVEPLVLPYVAPAATGVQPYTSEFFALVSAAISNVPATQLVLSTALVGVGAAPRLAVAAGLAGNLDPISSFANLLALTMVSRSGLPIRRAMAVQLAVGVVSFLPAIL